MALPDFTAETALYRSAGTYRTAPRLRGASPAIHPAVDKVLDPYSTGSGETGGAMEAAACYGPCCGMCSCCGNIGHPNCCTWCIEHCS
jgi:hypothetical protein